MPRRRARVLLSRVTEQPRGRGPARQDAREASGPPTFRYRSLQKMLAGVARAPRKGSERYTAVRVWRQLCSRSHTGMAAAARTPERCPPSRPAPPGTPGDGVPRGLRAAGTAAHTAARHEGMQLVSSTHIARKRQTADKKLSKSEGGFD